MQNLLKPKWLFIINTLPIVVLFFLFISEFNIIKSLLDTESIALWGSFGLSLCILGLLNLIYALFLMIRKQNVSVFYGVIALITYIPFIYLYGYHSDKIIPFSIPRWMIPGDMILYVGTFLMPTLAYSLFVLVSHFTPDAKEQRPWRNIVISIIVPVVWYLFSQVIMPLWKPVDSNFGTHALIIFIILGTLIFLFFLIRGIYILASKKADVWNKYQLAWKIPISIVLPLLGLAVNNGLLFNEFGDGIFGDFNGFWFYTLAVLNGVLICLPNLERKLYRQILFLGRSMSFAFTFYFFLVFLPFLPISIIAIVAIGTGFLMLTPLILFVIHINELSKDFNFLKSNLSIKRIWLYSLIGFLIIPICITTTFVKDKITLNETLEYLYTPDYSKTYKINKKSLQKTVDVLKKHKDRNGATLFGSQIPYISTYFNWLVLDNLTLSDAKINNIEKIFFGNPSFELQSENIRNDRVEITDINTESIYDKSQAAWRSWVNLEITNKSDNSWFAEYATTIDLPIGCWISDYYLYVGDKREKGILAEKKSAMWVFSQIRNENRDPGILYYLTGNKVAFRVFPFAKEEVRETGIELIHKEPVHLAIDGHIVTLGDSEESIDVNFENEDLIYLSASKKKKLNQIHRKPYFHFLVDISHGNEKNIEKFIGNIENTIKRYPTIKEDTKVSFVNSYVASTAVKENWKHSFKTQTFDGGFYLDRAIKKTLFESYINKEKSYPIIVVVTDSLCNAVLDKDFSDLRITFPENDLFYHLNEKQELIPFSLTHNPRVSLSDSGLVSLNHTVLEYKTKDNNIFYLPDNNNPSIILKKEFVEIQETEIKEKSWLSALIMHSNWISQNLHPEKSKKEWLSLVKSSFISKVMTPVTSYIVVENEAQKAILKKKQEQVLSSNKSLDVCEDAQRMSEPSLIILFILLGLIMIIREKKKYKISR